MRVARIAATVNVVRPLITLLLFIVATTAHVPPLPPGALKRTVCACCEPGMRCIGEQRVLDQHLMAQGGDVQAAPIDADLLEREAETCTHTLGEWRALDAHEGALERQAGQRDAVSDGFCGEQVLAAAVDRRRARRQRMAGTIGVVAATHGQPTHRNDELGDWFIEKITGQVVGAAANLDQAVAGIDFGPVQRVLELRR